MTDTRRPGTVTIHMTATDENGKPLGGIRREISIEGMRHAGFPLLIETAAAAASELEEVIHKHYGILPEDG
ncbi:hypothetical protein [Nissabacter sp. SGAir0207]|uniref:hypothetical protein n=1 Tax=Nissabacter sp. SGAir0207 TaxID=2126321 RepID=UPI0010CD1381|nr:hypothetical protein [Nissabacter sp. SGAir0207]QCR38957.1 hypothetical protein C1N62_22860 [Nissabacter sp. SGAir0207]